MNRVERKKEMLGKLKKLSSELVTDTEKLREFAERWRGGFRQYSFQNLLLIWFQKPEATLCAGFHQWKKHDRYAKAGEGNLLS